MAPNRSTALRNVALLSAVAAFGNAQGTTNFTCNASGGGAAYNATKVYLGCYNDPSVSILSAAKLSTIGMTPQYCANWCGERGFGYGGIEFGTQCFCGEQPNFGNAQKIADSRCSQKCATEPSSSCGATYVMSLYQITDSVGNASSGVQDNFTPACLTSPLCGNPVCDKTKSIEERVASLVSQLTTPEKILNLVDASAGAARLGLPAYEWWSEATHGVGSAPGVQFPNKPANFSYATSFPSPITSAAAFDDALIRAIGEVIGKEGRAFGNFGFAGFDYWAPNMNPFREPRWGRGQETPGEDVFHVQSYVRNLVPGMQGDDVTDKQVIATCKHYAAYDVESGRYGNNYNPSQQDLADYFLPAFKTCVRDVSVGSIMCSYNAVGGYPSCASYYLLDEVLRTHWNFTEKYQYVVGDCGAVQDIAEFHNFTDTIPDAASAALNAGTDLDCGSAYLTLNQSLALNSTTVARLDQALNRLYSALFTVGYFDGSKYDTLDWSDVGTPEAEATAYKAAVEGMTLLKNDKSFLPLSSGGKAKAALIGPYANATTQMQGDYSGPPKTILSPLQVFKNYSAWDVTYAQGTAINATNNTGFAAALTAAQGADVIFFLGGIDGSLENEQNDREDLAWPLYQRNLIAQLSALNKPIVVVQFGGGQLDGTPLFNDKNVKSVIWAGYPSQSGAQAILDTIVGKYAPAGRLPITQYPASYADEVSIFDIDLRANASSGYPGRTYKYYTGKAVRAFGYGLSYTKFSFKWGKTLRKQYNIQQLVDDCKKGHGSVKDITPFATVSATIRNTGKITSDFVGLLFISSGNAGLAPRPNKSLVSYARAHAVTARDSQTMDLPLTLGSLARSDADGSLTIYPGDYEIALDNDRYLTQKFKLTGKPAVIETLPKPRAEYDYSVPVHVQPESTVAHS
nr:hypothetical protein B0A51_11843 [Rachicladosporium sp. CCFEE 5018]